MGLTRGIIPLIVPKQVRYDIKSLEVWTENGPPHPKYPDKVPVHQGHHPDTTETQRGHVSRHPASELQASKPFHRIILEVATLENGRKERSFRDNSE